MIKYVRLLPLIAVAVSGLCFGFPGNQDKLFCPPSNLVNLELKWSAGSGKAHIKTIFVKADYWKFSYSFISSDEVHFDGRFGYSLQRMRSGKVENFCRYSVKIGSRFYKQNLKLILSERFKKSTKLCQAARGIGHLQSQISN